MPHMVMVHDVDPAEKLLGELGSLDNLDLFHNQVLVAIYERPKEGKTEKGLWVPQQHTADDRWQSKVGLLVKTGPGAFQPGGEWSWDVDLAVGRDWLLIRAAEGWSIDVNGVHCRILDDINVRGRVPHPDMVW